MRQKLLYFNPGHEAAILNGSPYYMLPSNVAVMQTDLAYLPAWCTTPENYILLENNLPDNFVSLLNYNNITISKGVIPTLLQSISSKLLAHPWGISPQVLHFFENIKNKYDANLEIPRWNSELSHLSSRFFARECLTNLCSIIPELDSSIIPDFYSDIVEIENLVEKENRPLLAKAPFSSSGRGLLWLPVSGLTRTEIQILSGMIKKQKGVSVERVLNKKLDFAMEFIVSDEGKANFEGYSLFETNSKGAYLGNYLGSQQRIEDKIYTYIDKALLETVKSSLRDILENHFSEIYTGCIGVDMMVYEKENNYMLHPCVEINVRNNMGLVAIGISRNYLSCECEGKFYIDYTPNDGELIQIHNEMSDRYPAIFADGKIKSGYLSLCPISQNTKYRAYILVK